MSQGHVSLLDTITRIYKNSNGKVIGLHCISLQETKDMLPSPIPGEYPSLRDRRKRGVQISHSFERLNLDIGGSRIVTSIQMLGAYDDFVTNSFGNDIERVIYFGNSDKENDLIISMKEFPTIGSIL